MQRTFFVLRTFCIVLLLAGLLSLFNHQQARAVTLQDLVAPGTTVQQVASGFGFIEGPVWQRDGYLLFSDTPRAQIRKWHPTTGLSVYREPVTGTNGLTFDTQNRLVIAEQDGRQLVREELNGTLVTLASTYLGSKLNSPNDVALTADGSIYFTDPPYGLANGTVGKELTFNGVFRLSPTGTLTVLTTEFDRPNGLAFSPNEKILYIADTTRGMVRAFDVLADGSITNSHLFAGMTNPDGLKVDVNGNVWVAGGSGVLIYDPNGVQIGTISLPEQPSNIGFGDSDLKTLYITARTGLYKIRLLVAGIPHYGLRAMTPTATVTNIPNPSAIRIEAGGAANFTDSLGNVWLSDRGFTVAAGGVADRGAIAIANTVEDRIYQTERWGMTAFAYAVPNGTYQVNLHFAETYTGITAAGQRVFSANVEGTNIANIDVFAQTGGLNRALFKTATVTVSDGQLNITFTATANNPEINGIEIIPSGPALTATPTRTPSQTAIPTNTSTRTVTPTMTNTLPTSNTATRTMTPTRTPTPNAAAIRIEAGGAANFTDSLGNVWLSDRNFTVGAGGVADRGAIAIANTVEDRIYQTERWGMTAFAYPVTNGAYQVNLHFAETYTGITAAGQRVFSANVEGTAINNIDVFAQTGGLNRALVKSACVTVADGQLSIAFTAIANNPEINGIEIIPAASCPVQVYTGTPYGDTVYTGGAQPIPGRIKFAYYDFGGEGVAYHDIDAANQGSCGLNPCDGSYLNEFRKNEAGDTSYVKFGNNPQIDDSPYTLVTQTANSLYLGWTVAGEWTKYTVNVQQAGLYSINVMYTKPQPGTFSLSFNNQDLTGPLDLLSTFNAADTLDWRNWHHWNKANGVAQVRLTAGVQVLTLNINMNGNFDYADFVYVGP